jgi:ferredoxin-nitrate reductase
VEQRIDRALDVWGDRTPYSVAWPARIDERTVETPTHWVQSCCVLCSNGCALDIGVRDGKMVGVRGRGIDPVNRGRLGPKGLYGWEANHSPDRLRRPLLRRNGKLEETTWEEAMSELVRRTTEIRDRFTSNAIGIYNSGQLFLEEYYALAVVARAGLGTPHVDGNTRLCTATAAASLRETFGSDGQPGSYADVDLTECLLLMGHNVAETQTVLWSRILDRRQGPNPPKLIVVDPRETATAKEADVHLAPRVGTNVALLNGLLNLVIEGGYLDRTFVESRTVGFEKLKATVSSYTPERVEELTGVPAMLLREAAQMVGTSPTLLSTCLQGVYQSWQATAAACQVNNLNLILGMIGRPGCGVLQMNGQPTSQNARETGCDGEFPVFLNWQNPAHVADVARHWKVEPDVIPHWAPPTHALDIFRHAEEGSIKMLWIVATNPAVSMPDLARIRGILEKEDLFVVVQDAFLTETAKLADLVLPAAIWGEKTGTFTNTERTVHLSLKAVEPPGEARTDLDIFLEFSRRMGFQAKDGTPLTPWTTPEQVFEAWKELTKGKRCDYSGMTYSNLSNGTGVRWPCNEEFPEGGERLYAEGVFPTSADVCESFGHDLATGAAVTPEEYRANDPGGRAILKAAEYEPFVEAADGKYPFLLTTGRVAHQFHTRTKTGRAPRLQEAAPDAFVQISADDAVRLNIRGGDLVEVVSRRGRAQAPARIGDIAPGHVFMPFHYGYWDNPDRPRAANELTLLAWDPVSKQPFFKIAAVRLAKIDRYSDGHADRRSKTLTGTGKAKAKDLLQRSKKFLGLRRAHLEDYLGLLQANERELVIAFREIAVRHEEQSDVRMTAQNMSRWSEASGERLAPLIGRYGSRRGREPKRLREALLEPGRMGGFGMLRDLHDLWMMAEESLVILTILHQAAKALRDADLLDVVTAVAETNSRQAAWLLTRIKRAAPQALIVPS